MEVQFRHTFKEDFKSLISGQFRNVLFYGHIQYNRIIFDNLN
jgi:hypothetical protein